MFIHFYTHDILIFALNFNNILFNIKLHVNYICVIEWLFMIDFFCAYKY